MTTAEGKNPVVARQLEALANAAKDYTLAKLANISGGSGGSSGGGVNVLDTVPATVDGGLWYEVTDNVPQLKLRMGNYEYAFTYYQLKFVGDASDALVAYLPFNVSTTDDAFGNVWTATGSPVIVDGALYLDESSYLESSDTEFMFPVSSFTVDFWAKPENDGAVFFCFNKKIATSGSTKDSWICLDLYHNHPRFDFASDQTSADAVSISMQEWHHFAITYNESEYKCYLDGAHVLTKSISFESEPGGATRIGTNGQFRNYYKGYIKHYRITAGAVLWTEDFTPPTAEDYL